MKPTYASPFEAMLHSSFLPWPKKPLSKGKPGAAKPARPAQSKPRASFKRKSA